MDVIICSIVRVEDLNSAQRHIIYYDMINSELGLKTGPSTLLGSPISPQHYEA